jgi:GntR family transcriptional regulator
VIVISIDLASGTPLEEQIHRELRRAIAAGTVGPGDRLPSARQLGADLGVHWNTVARAYRRLHEEGLATVGRGRHVVVRRPAPDPVASRERVGVKLRDLVTEARLAGMTPTAVQDALRAELDSWDWKVRT